MRPGEYRIHVYGDVKPVSPKVEAPIDCRTCQWAGLGACTLFAHQCREGESYKATKPAQFWRQS